MIVFEVKGVAKLNWKMQMLRIILLEKYLRVLIQLKERDPLLPLTNLFISCPQKRKNGIFLV